MKRLTHEWIAKAEEDFVVAEWLTQAPVASPAAVGFHCQQCVEKYLKGVLTESDIDFPKTHDLMALVRLLPDGPRHELEPMRELEFLQPFAANSRYPGIVVSDADAIDAVQICGEARKLLRRQLGL